MSIRPERAEAILNRFTDQRILVVGDLMWDRYIYGAVSRISPEAPVPIVEVGRESHMPGGASNVAWNIQTLAAQAVACGILGRDDAAEELKAFFEREGVDASAALQFEEARTTLKMRIVAESQQVVRVDWDNQATLTAAHMKEFCERIQEEVGKSTGVIIEDYGKGVVQQQVVDTVLAAAAKHGVPTGLDPKDNRELLVKGVTVATPNRKEAFHVVGHPESAAGPDPMTDGALLEVSSALLEKWDSKLLLITLGAQGMLLAQKDCPPKHVPTRAREVYDVSGAGDTVIAACVLALSAGATFEEAAELANHASGVVVGHVGTASCTPAEVLDSVKIVSEGS